MPQSVLTSTDTELFDPQLYYANASEVGSLFTEMPTDVYMRGSTGTISQEDLDQKKEDLIYREDGVIPMVRVNDPFVAYWSNDPETGERKLFLQDGNTRRRNLIEMQNDDKYKSFTYAPVPYRILTVENPSKAILYRLQIDSNDTTSQHTVAQKAEAFSSMFHELSEELQNPTDSSKALSKAKAEAEAKRQLAQNFSLSVARIGQLLDVEKWPIAFIDLIGEGRLISTYRLAADIYTFCKDDKVDLELWVVVNHLKDLVDVKKSPGITPAQFKKYKENYFQAHKTLDETAGQSQTGEGVESTDETGTETTNGKAPKEFDREQAIANVNRSLASVYQQITDGDMLVEYKEEELDLVSQAASQAIKFVSTVVTKQELPKSVAPKVYDLVGEFVVKFYDEIMADHLDDLDPDLVAALERIALGVSKPLAMLQAEDSLETDEEDPSTDEYETSVETDEQPVTA